MYVIFSPLFSQFSTVLLELRRKIANSFCVIERLSLTFFISCPVRYSLLTYSLILSTVFLYNH